MKIKKICFFSLLFLFLTIDLLAQKPIDKKNNLTIGLSYKQFHFFDEDYAVHPSILENGRWSDGLLGLNMQYLYGLSHIIGIATDYKFLVGSFDRGFTYKYQVIDFAHGHEIYIGPAITIGKGPINFTIRAQIGYSYLKVNGQESGSWTSYSGKGNITYMYTGSDPAGIALSNYLNNHSSSNATVYYYEGYPDFLRKKFLYQTGFNLNFPGDIISTKIFIDYCPILYNNNKHNEFDAGVGITFHF